MSTPYQKAYFLLSVADVKQLPPDTGFEVAIVGRSNAGKSSVLNRITRKGLARVSKTPGRTRLLNVFVLDEMRRLVDLPGYGFAKAPASDKQQWQKAVDAYFRDRQSLKGLILVMDIRHPLKDLDLQLLSYCQHLRLPVHVLLNKADKLSKSRAAMTLQALKAALTHLDNSVSFQVFSALTGTGLKELHLCLDTWYHYQTRLDKSKPEDKPDKR